MNELKHCASGEELAEFLQESNVGGDGTMVFIQAKLPDGSVHNGIRAVTVSEVIPHLRWERPVRVLTLDFRDQRPEPNPDEKAQNILPFGGQYRGPDGRPAGPHAPYNKG